MTQEKLEKATELNAKILNMKKNLEMCNNAIQECRNPKPGLNIYIEVSDRNHKIAGFELKNSLQSVSDILYKISSDLNLEINKLENEFKLL